MPLTGTSRSVGGLGGRPPKSTRPLDGCRELRTRCWRRLPRATRWQIVPGFWNLSLMPCPLQNRTCRAMARRTPWIRLTPWGALGLFGGASVYVRNWVFEARPANSHMPVFPFKTSIRCWRRRCVTGRPYFLFWLRMSFTRSIAAVGVARVPLRPNVTSLFIRLRCTSPASVTRV